MQPNYLKSTTIFDTNVLKSGEHIELVVPPMDFNNEKRFKAMIKQVTPFSIILLVGHLDSVENGYVYMFEEEEYPIEMFEGSNAHRLLPLYTEEEWQSMKE